MLVNHVYAQEVLFDFYSILTILNVQEVMTQYTLLGHTVYKNARVFLEKENLSIYCLSMKS